MKKLFFLSAYCTAMMYTCSSCRPAKEAEKKTTVQFSLIPKDKWVATVGNNLLISNAWYAGH